MDKEKPRVLFVSDLVVPTGFSTVAHNIIKNLENDFDFVGIGVNYKGDPHSHKFPIYPATNGPSNNIYGIDRVVAILNAEKFDLMFILNDAWVVSYYLDAIKKHVTNIPKIVVYFPVDAEDHNPAWYKDFDIVSKATTYTEFGKNVLKGCVPNIEFTIVPHGVDTDVFFKVNDTKSNIRKALFGKDTPNVESIANAFIILNGNRNQPRKKLDVTMRGFSLFAKDKPDVRLYMHCGVRDSSVDIPYLSLRYGIDNKLIVTSLAVGIQRVDIQKLNLIYNACDVGINTSMGEGWGLVNVEHAVTGAVQVVPKHSACHELFHDCGMMMETSDRFVFDNSQTTGKLVTDVEVAYALEKLYRNRELMRSLGEAGMNKFSSEKYSWKFIAKQWKEVFLEALNSGSDSPVS